MKNKARLSYIEVIIIAIVLGIVSVKVALQFTETGLFQVDGSTAHASL
ncbi:MAG: hypothetical protein ACYTDW_14650 [Planctomycetota bacterium]|jgi:hypothetical protein